MPDRLARLISIGAMAAAVAVLSACSASNRFPPACPALALLPDAADLTRFRPGGQDITDMIIDARIVAIPATCSQKADTSNLVAATLRVNMGAQRGPAASGHTVPLPYFVAVMDGSRVLDRQEYTVPADFPSNASQTLISSPPIDLVFPVTPQKSAAAYRIFVGYVLTPDELATNRKRGAR